MCVLTRFWWYSQAIGFLLHIFPVPAGRGRFVVTFCLIQILLGIASSMILWRSEDPLKFQTSKMEDQAWGTSPFKCMSYHFDLYYMLYTFFTNDRRSSTLPCESMAPRLLHVDQKQSHSRLPFFILKHAKILRARNVKDGFLLYY